MNVYRYIYVSHIWDVFTDMCVRVCVRVCVFMRVCVCVSARAHARV